MSCDQGKEGYLWEEAQGCEMEVAANRHSSVAIGKCTAEYSYDSEAVRPLVTLVFVPGMTIATFMLNFCGP